MKPANPNQIRLFGGNRALFVCQAPEVCLEGPAGTGKSVAAALKLFVACELVPGVRCLIVRKTRVSLTQSTLVTFERIVPKGHSILEGASRAHRPSYQFQNGSEIALLGLDSGTMGSRIRSTEFDLIWVEEGFELHEEEFENLTGRCRNGVLPYQQLMTTTNPDRANHWLNRRCSEGATLRLLSRHTDNPGYFDHATGEWTPFGNTYRERLSKLTGARRKRLFEGKWAGSEGLVYEGWDAAVHVVKRFEVPTSWRRVWVVDFGFTNPFVWQNWAIDPDGRAFLVQEIYQTQTLVSDHAKTILSVTDRQPRPSAIVCDHDAEDRATLSRALGMGTITAKKDVSPGIQAVENRLRVAGDGKPRLFVMEGALVRRDETLADSRKPCSTVEEFDGYVWEPSVQGKPNKEAPLKLDDHGMDATRYLVMHEENPRRDFIGDSLTLISGMKQA